MRQESSSSSGSGISGGSSGSSGGERGSGSSSTEGHADRIGRLAAQQLHATTLKDTPVAAALAIGSTAVETATLGRSAATVQSHWHSETSKGPTPLLEGQPVAVEPVLQSEPFSAASAFLSAPAVVENIAQAKPLPRPATPPHRPEDDDADAVVEITRADHQRELCAGRQGQVVMAASAASGAMIGKSVRLSGTHKGMDGTILSTSKGGYYCVRLREPDRGSGLSRAVNVRPKDMTMLDELAPDSNRALEQTMVAGTATGVATMPAGNAQPPDRTIAGRTWKVHWSEDHKAWYWWEQGKDQTTWDDPQAGNLEGGAVAKVYNSNGTIANVAMDEAEQVLTQWVEQAALDAWISATGKS